MTAQLPIHYWKGRYDTDQKDHEENYNYLAKKPFGEQLGWLWGWKGLKHKEEHVDEDMAEYIKIDLKE